MCSSRVLLGLESSARARSRNQRSRADMFESSHVGGCKYKMYVRYISTYEQIYLLLYFINLTKVHLGPCNRAFLITGQHVAWNVCII